MKCDREQLQFARKLRQRKQREPYQVMIRPPHALVTAFVVPVVVMMMILIQRGTFPFGEESILVFDLYDQYAPFFQSFSIS